MGRTEASYTEEQRTAALVLYREHGAGVAAKRTGIPRSTISAWARRRSVHRQGHEPQPRRRKRKQPRPWRERRGELEGELQDLLDDFLDRARGARQASEGKGWAITAGIVFDKLEILDGRRGEGKDGPQTAGEFDGEVEKLIEQIETRVEERVRKELGEQPEPRLNPAAEAEISRMREELADVETRAAELVAQRDGE